MTSEKNTLRFNTPFVGDIARKAKKGHIRYVLGTHVRVYHQMESILVMYDGTVVELDHDYRWEEYEKKETLKCKVIYTVANSERYVFVEFYREQPRSSQTATTGIRLSPSTQGLSLSQSAASKISFQIDSKIMLAEDGVLKI